MPKFVLNIGTDSLVDFTNKLEKLKKHDLPIVVRQTLNNVSFHAKKKEIPKTYAASFKKRVPGFVMWASTVTPAKGLKVKGMESSIGILDKKMKATSNLAIHEVGGDTPDNIFETSKSRIGADWNKRVKKKYKLNKGSSPYFGRKIGGGNKKRIVREAYKRTNRYTQKVFMRIENNVYEIKRKRSENKIDFLHTYVINDGKHHNARKTSFMYNAMSKSVKDKLHKSFIRNANARFLK